MIAPTKKDEDFQKERITSCPQRVRKRDRDRKMLRFNERELYVVSNNYGSAFTDLSKSSRPKKEP